jgi:hypothetical protein
MEVKPLTEQVATVGTLGPERFPHSIFPCSPSRPGSKTLPYCQRWVWHFNHCVPTAHWTSLLHASAEGASTSLLHCTRLSHNNGVTGCLDRYLGQSDECGSVRVLIEAVRTTLLPVRPSYWFYRTLCLGPATPPAALLSEPVAARKPALGGISLPPNYFVSAWCIFFGKPNILIQQSIDSNLSR